MFKHLYMCVYVTSALKRWRVVRWTCSCSSQRAVRRRCWRRRDAFVSWWTNTACSPTSLALSMKRYNLRTKWLFGSVTNYSDHNYIIYRENQFGVWSIASCCHSDENLCTVSSTDYSCFLLISFLMSAPAGPGQRHTDGKAEQLAGPVQRCHQHAWEHFVHDWGIAYTSLYHTDAFSLSVTPQRGMLGLFRVKIWQLKLCFRDHTH